MTSQTTQINTDANEDSSRQLRRVLGGVQDALTDEMVSRLAASVSAAADLLDQLGRSGVDRAVPILARMVENGDLERIADLARALGAAQDAVTDEMIVRLTEVLNQTVILFDRMNRSGLDRMVGLLPRMLDLFERLEQRRLMDDLLQCLDQAGAQAATAAPARGGLRGLWELMREPDTQDALRFLLTAATQLRACRAQRAAAGAAPARSGD